MPEWEPDTEIYVMAAGSLTLKVETRVSHKKKLFSGGATFNSPLYLPAQK